MTLLRPLTGLRAAAAGWVVIHHYYPAAVGLMPGLSFLEAFAHAGFIGVEVFFTLSGFIISYTYLERFQRNGLGSYPDFLWKRLARIYPAYLFTLFGLLIIVLVAVRMGVTFDAGTDYSAGSFLASALMVQAWGDGGIPRWNSVAWSVSAEWLAYLLFPLLAAASSRLGRSFHVLALGYAVLIGCLALASTRTLAGITGFDFVDILRVLGCFVAGMAMHQLYADQIGARWRWEVLTPALAVGVILLACLIHSGGGNAIWTALVIPWVILGLAYQRNDVVSNWFSASFMQYWGRVSYSLYLSHLIVLAVLNQLVGSRVGAPELLTGGALVVGYFAAAGMVGALIYRFVEEPGRRLMLSRA